MPYLTIVKLSDREVDCCPSAVSVALSTSRQRPGLSLLVVEMRPSKCTLLGPRRALILNVPAATVRVQRRRWRLC